MKVLLIYFSGTGNTKILTELYRAELENNNCEVTVVSLPDSGEQINPAAFDLIGIGYPIHAFNAPEIILDYCKALKKLPKNADKKRAFIYKTSGEPVRMSDASSLKMRKILKKRGYEVYGEYQYVMPYNIIFRHSDKAAYRMLETAKALVPVDAKEILSNIKHLPDKPPFGGLVSWVLRIEHPGARLIGRFYHVEKDKCKDCGLCVNTCPAKNINYDKNGKIVFGGNCMMCMRCAFNCPKNAINLGLFNGWKVNGRYTFDPPEEETDAPSKHDNYCRKAYDRYYKTAAERIHNNSPQDN